jgi:hypothetical protein
VSPFGAPALPFCARHNATVPGISRSVPLLCSFLDPNLLAPKLKIAATLLKRKLGLRSMLNVIPLDAKLVKGSHGVAPLDPRDGAMIATTNPSHLDRDAIEPTDVRQIILRHLE